MKLLLQEIRRNPLLWLLVFVPIALEAEETQTRFQTSALRNPCRVGSDSFLEGNRTGDQEDMNDQENLLQVPR